MHRSHLQRRMADDRVRPLTIGVVRFRVVLRAAAPRPRLARGESCRGSRLASPPGTHHALGQFPASAGMVGGVASAIRLHSRMTHSVSLRSAASSALCDGDVEEHDTTEWASSPGQSARTTPGAGHLTAPPASMSTPRCRLLLVNPRYGPISSNLASGLPTLDLFPVCAGRRPEASL
jgi:hypothetical protein